MTMTTSRPGQAGDEDQPLSLAARLPEIVGRWMWRHRWKLAPIWLAAAAMIAAAAGLAGSAAGVTGAAAAGLEALARTEVAGPGGRMFLSVRERRLAAAGLGVTAAWSVITLLLPVPPLAGGLLLGAGLAWPSWQWWASRRKVPPPPPLWSPLAGWVLEGWAQDITVGGGPSKLRGSVPLPETLVEPAEGAVAVDIQLAHGVHAEDAASSANRRTVEALLGMPKDTVRLETLRDHSTRIRAVITPERHLEKAGGLDWPGPVLTQDGQIPLAETGDGGEVAIPLFGESGVKHGLITGTSDVGKSVTSVAVLMPGVAAGIELVIYVDGKRGTSAPPSLRKMIVCFARVPEQWRLAIEIAYRILVEREERRGIAGLHRWRGWDEDDPIITLFLDEVGTINDSISSKHVQMILKILQRGRAAGVRVIQTGQSPNAEHIIGNMGARALMMGQGWAICHRAGSKQASRLGLDSTNADVSLLGLPVGQAAITIGGQLAAFPAQVRYAKDERIQEEAEHIQPRPLTGKDLTAAGPDWTASHWEACWTEGFDWKQHAASAAAADGIQATDQAADQDGEDDELPTSRRWVLDQLAQHPDGLTLRQLEDAPSAPSRRTISNALADLLARHSVSKNGAIWTHPEPDEAGDET